MTLRVLVIGGAGAQGRPVAEQLLERRHQVRVLGRNPAKVASLLADGAQFARGDLSDRASLRAACDGMDSMFLLMPTDIWPPRAYECVQNVMEAAKAAGIRHVVYTTSGAISERRLRVAFIDAKSAIAQRVMQAPIPVTLLSPAVFLDNLLSPFSFPDVRLRGQLTWPYAADAPISWITLADHARHAVAALESGATETRVLRVACAEAVTGEQLAQLFSDVMRRPIRYRAQPLIEFMRRARPAMGTLAAAALAQVFRYHRRAGTDLIKYPDAAQTTRLLGLEPMSIQDSVTQILQPLMAPASEPDKLHAFINKPDVKNSIHYRGQLISMLAEPAGTDATVCAWTGCCPRGLGPPVHVHTREHEMFYVTKGRLKVGVDAEIYELRPGNFVFLPANRPHWFAPLSDSVEMLGITVPIRGKNDSWNGQDQMFRGSGTPANCLALPPYPAAPDDVAQLVAQARKLGIVVLEPNPLMFDPANSGPIAWFARARHAAKRMLARKTNYSISPLVDTATPKL